MTRYVGLHLGSQSVSAIALSARGKRRKAAQWSAPEGREQWRYTEADIDALIELLSQFCSRGKTVICVSLPAQACFLRRVETALPSNREALGYAVEGQLPLPIDNLQIVHGDQSQRVALAVPSRPWRDVLDGLDNAGWVCPRVMSGHSALWLQQRSAQGSGLRMVLVADETQACMVIGDQQQIHRLRSVPIRGRIDDAAAAKLHSEIHRTWASVVPDQPLAGQAFITETWQDKPLLSDGPLATSALEQRLGDVPACSAGMLLAEAVGRAQLDSAPGNIRTGPWASAIERGRMRLAGMLHGLAAAVVVLAAAGGVWLHAQQVQARIDTYKQQCDNVWLELFPDSRPPVDVQGRLASERRRESGVRAGGASVPEHLPVLDLIRELVQRLPSDIPIQVRQLDLDSGLSVMVGQARTHGEVERIAAALAEAQTIEVQPASTERTTNGLVRFSIRFQRKDPGVG